MCFNACRTLNRPSWEHIDFRQGTAPCGWLDLIRRVSKKKRWWKSACWQKEKQERCEYVAGAGSKYFAISFCIGIEVAAFWFWGQYFSAISNAAKPEITESFWIHPLFTIKHVSLWEASNHALVFHFAWQSTNQITVTWLGRRRFSYSIYASCWGSTSFTC